VSERPSGRPREARSDDAEFTSASDAGGCGNQETNLVWEPDAGVNPASSVGFGCADPPAGLSRLANSSRYLRADSK